MEMEVEGLGKGEAEAGGMREGDKEAAQEKD